MLDFYPPDMFFRLTKNCEAETHIATIIEQTKRLKGSTWADYPWIDYKEILEKII